MKKTHLLFLIGLLIWLGLNLAGLRKDHQRILNFRKDVPRQNIGEAYQLLKPFVQNITIMGYYTDFDLTENDRAAKDFAHAQYILAPTVLDLNTLNHDYTFFHCSQPEIALAMIKMKGLQLLKGNSLGMFLAKRP